MYKKMYHVNISRNRFLGKGKFQNRGELQDTGCCMNSRHCQNERPDFIVCTRPKCFLSEIWSWVAIQMGSAYHPRMHVCTYLALPLAEEVFFPLKRAALLCAVYVNAGSRYVCMYSKLIL